ncbi:MAG: PLP-dependent aminotransferase family protein [Anaerolineae bacterium]|nr:PLP-dependent aminotransferase family protein [Anaerolineae bacterium]
MFFSRLELDRDKSRALYLQVADHLRHRIESGELACDTRLPASRVLAKQLGVNRVTVVNAYAELEAEGLVTTKVGSGTYVTAANETSVHDDQTPMPVRLGGPPLRRHWNAGQMMNEMMRLARQPGVLSFAAGTPASEFIPVNEFRRAINDVLRRDGADALQYEEASGYFPLRQVIAEMLQDQDIEVKANDILITAGCQQAMDIALQVMARGKDNVLVVEEPCYLGLLDLLSSKRITPVGVPMDEHGMRVDQLEQIILRHRPSLIYSTPNFHNPTGISIPLERRMAMLEIAARYGVPILEDTTYDELYYESKPLPTLKSLDTNDIVFHAGGFSKTLVPGIRIGYLVAPQSLQERVVTTKQTTDILTSPLNQRALHAYLESGGFPDHLKMVRTAYQTRRDTMLAAMEQHFPDEARWQRPGGGIYLWVEMPQPGPTATELYLTAINYNVAFSIGSVFSAGGYFAHAMRLNFAGCPPDEIEEGIRRLGKAWKELLSRSNTLAEPRRVSLHIL